MKNFKVILTFIIFVLFIYSCTDIIVLDLKNTKPQIVILANLNTSDSTFSVKLTKSNDYYEEGDFKLVTGANIILKKENGTSYAIPETEDGFYFLNNIITKPEDVFTVKITDNKGITYSATTIVPYPSKILQIFPAPFNPPGGGNPEEGKNYFQITTLWKDTVNINNYYRIKTYINNKLEEKDYSLADDRFEDGDTMVAASILELNHLDTLKLELLSTDKQYFDYFLDVAILYNKGPGNTTPYNPKSNFDNNALGYFGIYSVSKFEFILP